MPTRAPAEAEVVAKDCPTCGHFPVFEDDDQVYCRSCGYPDAD